MIDAINLRFVTSQTSCRGLVAGPVIAATEFAMSLSELMDDEFLIVAVAYRGAPLTKFDWSLPPSDLREFRKLRDAGDLIVTKRRMPGSDEVVVLAKLARV